AAPPPAEPGAPVAIAAAPRTVANLGDRAEGEGRMNGPADEILAPAGRDLGRSEEAKKKEAADDRDGERMSIASSARAGGGAGAAAGLAPAAPAAKALSAYRAAESRRARATRRPLTPAEQHAADMATFEILQWMDPAADGGPMLELQEADFTLP
ncbi:MAG: hypothetical protein FJZ01_22940, partial [Candidatus Sericytochromatia bacterium]|nr:hypothetical protein [Candidatus Tanganyikabacteria bacterium]